MHRCLLPLLAALCLTAAAYGADRPVLREHDRILFLGDSITNAGMYVQYVDACLTTRYPDRQYEVINLGLPSEGVTGLSEPEHPFPRPDVRERLSRALDRVKPDLVVVCYGMNDGIYYPFSEERFHQYQEAYRQVLDRIRRAGARVVIATPPPFDVVPVKAVALPAGAPKYSWVHPYAGYDEVLTRYSRWLLTFRDQNIPVADVHAAVTRYLERARRDDPGYHVTNDGVHPNESGEWPIAQEILTTLGVPADVDYAEIDAARRKAKEGTVTGIIRAKGTLSFHWTSRVPLPQDAAWEPHLAERTQMNDLLNRYRLKVTGLPAGRYSFSSGDTLLGEVTAQQLKEGLDLLRFPQLPTNHRATEVLPLVRRRERLLSAAWLSAVGHKRPGVAPGLPLAEAQQQAEPLTRQIRELCRPTELDLCLTPVANAAHSSSASPGSGTAQAKSTRPFVPTSAYSAMNVQGWTVHVNRQLLGPQQELGRRAIALLDQKLCDIRISVSSLAVAKLQRVPLWLGVNDGHAPCSEYHPNRDWLAQNGYNPDKAKCVEIGNAARFLDWSRQQPSMVLHELAHAYHDQVLGFNNAEVRSAYQAAVAGGKYRSVRRYNGRMERHYALTNPQEYFAECTEAYFGKNDFYPFVREELKEFDPIAYRLLGRVWNPDR